MKRFLTKYGRVLARAAIALGVLGYFVQRWSVGDRRFLTPGRLTPGHRALETECELCHVSGSGVTSEACLVCHAAELERVDDSHPLAKFQDPRNAERLTRLDARRCAVCHTEHRLEAPAAMGVTQPSDTCRLCHDAIATDRPSHRGLSFATCQDAGCHNFHDNRTLHEDYLAHHLGDPETLPRPRVPVLTRAMLAGLSNARAPLNRADHDAPASVRFSQTLLLDWAETVHAKAGVNCSACHTASDQAAEFKLSPDPAACKACHADEVSGFLASRHGMPLAAGLTATTPGRSELPMRQDAAQRELGCSSCHAAHRFDRQQAALEACLHCHADAHSLAYDSSKHRELLRAERAGRLDPGSGVSCATCHLPRLVALGGGAAWVSHNPNDWLRPNEKMLEAICGRCHGVGFSIDALADRSLIARGVDGRPARRVASLDMVRNRIAQPAPGAFP